MILSVRPFHWPLVSATRRFQGQQKLGMLAGLLQAFEGRDISGITTRIEKETDALDLSLPTHEKNSVSNLLAPTLNARRNTARFWNSWQDLAWNPAASLWVLQHLNWHNQTTAARLQNTVCCMLIGHDLRLTFGTTVVGGTRAWLHPLELIVHTASQTGLFSLAPTSRCRWKAFARPYPFDGEASLHTSETAFLQVVTGSFVLNNPPQTTPDIHPPRHTGQTSPAACAEKTPSGDRDSKNQQTYTPLFLPRNYSRCPKTIIVVPLLHSGIRPYQMVLLQ